MTLFQSRVFTLAKDPQRPEENQDACRLDPSRGLAAIADGVTSAIFSRQWAAILAEAAMGDPPDPRDRVALAEWLARRRETWSGQIDTSRLAWFQTPKLREGAFSTLLWISLTAERDGRDGSDPAYWLRGFAVGDSCLFLVRDGRLVRKFPLERAADFDVSPMVIGSVDLNRDALLEFHQIDEPCRPGDLVILSTDAAAEWALRREESGDPPAWEQYWDKTEDAWRQEVLALRDAREIRYDDTTVVILRVGVPANEGEDGSPSLLRSCERAAAVPPSLPAASTPPPLPSTPQSVDLAPSEQARAQEQPWLDRVASLSGRLADQVAGGVSRAMEKFRQLRSTVESAVRKRRDDGDAEDPREDPRE